MTQETALLTFREICERAPIVQRLPLVIRLFQIDTRARMKLRGALELLSPQTIDAWRQHAGIDALFERGVWPVLTYYDIELLGHSIAPGFTSEAATAICLGRLKDGGLVQVAQTSCYGYRSSGQLETLRHKITDTPELVAKVRLMSGLIQPFKPNEFVLREVPPEYSALALYPCPASPSIDALSKLDSDFDLAGTPLEQSFVWAMHQSDSTQLILNFEYLYSAEDLLARLIHSADLPLTAYRSSRVQAVYKRPFLPGQSCVIRGVVSVRKEDKAVVGLIGFHPVDAPNSVSDTPAVFVRLDGAFQS